MKKRFLLILMVICLALSACGHDEESSEPSSVAEEENVIWTLSGDTMTLKGEGEMKDYDDTSSRPWTGIEGKIKTVIISEGITYIGSHAFAKFKALESVIIPHSVTTIGQGAFMDCTSLKEINLPETVTSIDDHVFNGCTSLEKFTFPSKLTNTGTDTFFLCESLSEVTFGNSINVIDARAFFCCVSLTSVNIPKSVERIHDNAFALCENLAVINYAGTKSEWNAIIKGDLWDGSITTYTVKCTDGDITSK